MRPAEDVEKLIRNIRYKTGAEMHERTLNDALEAQAKSRKAEWASAHSNIWRIIMKSSITKLATAAAIIITATVGINHFWGSFDGSSVVFAEVLKKIQEANSAVWHEQRVITCDGEDLTFLNSETTRYYSFGYGSREDMYNTEGLLLHQVYWLTEENARIEVAPLLKQYKRTELTEVESMVWSQVDIEAAVGKFANLEATTELGRKKINGRDAEGFEVRDSQIAGAFVPVKFDSLVARFWIDVKTSMPVCYEAELVISDRHITFLTGGKAVEVEVIGDKFQWDVELEPSVFEPNIPPDYIPMEY
jgi:hypothetical protein